MSLTPLCDMTYEEAREIVQVAIGQASTCWSDLSGAGGFDAERAIEIGDELLAELGFDKEKAIGAIVYGRGAA